MRATRLAPPSAGQPWLPGSRHPLLLVAGSVVVLGLGLEWLCGCGVGGSSLANFSSTWAYTIVEWIAVVGCVVRVWIRREDRLAWGLMAAALGAWSAGDLVWTVWLDHVASPPYPSAADLAYLLMYPAMYGSMMLLIRSRLRNAGVAQWLDGAVVGLAVAAIAAAIVFDTVLRASHGRFVAELVTVAYPVGDLALLMIVAVAVILANLRPGRVWALIGLGVALMAGADIIYVYDVARGDDISGSLLNAVYLTALVLPATAAWLPDRRPTIDRVHAAHTIGVTLLAASVALAVLVIGGITHVSVVAVAIAGAALAVATVRASLTYMENSRMLRRSAEHAITDALTGLGNRRRLMVDLEDAIRLCDRNHTATLVFLDLNGFKRYNDGFGHAAGDALLARIGASLAAAAAPTGNAYRLGGDEFCVLAIGPDGADDAYLRRLADATVERGSAFAIDASVGRALIPDEASTASAALQLADERMYAGKSRTSRAQARDVVMQILAERDPGLAGRIDRVPQLAATVAGILGLGSDERDEIVRAAEMHDVGKLALPDEILDKPGPLSVQEWAFVRQHPAIGQRILGVAPALAPVARLVRATHERWDGSGYPDGLTGEQIPIGARIVSVCDAYAAITTERAYRPARGIDEAIRVIEQEAGRQFDPVVVAALAEHLRSADDDATTNEPRPVVGSVR